MYEMIENEVIRNENSTIPYRWIRGKQANKSLCIMLPGLGYSTLQPLFHYATNVMADNKIDILHINYHFVKNKNFPQLSKTEQEQWIYEDVRAVVNEVIDQMDYEQCFLLSKSIGTIPMAMEWAQMNFIKNPIGIWLTPLLKENSIFQSLLKTEFPSLFVIGDRDQHYSKERICTLRTNELLSKMIIANADHSLEVNGDISATMEAMKVIMIRIQDFIKLYKI